MGVGKFNFYMIKPSGAVRLVKRIAKLVRFHDWWDYKVSVIVAVYAATALQQHVTLTAVSPGALRLLAGIVLAAIFASVVNDLTDIRSDIVAGKPNQVAAMPHQVPLAILAAILGAGAGLGWAWRHDLTLVLPYAGIWMAFALYSVPPFRLKARGLHGVIAMGLGEAALPTVFAVALCFRAADRPIDPLWVAAIGAWSFCHGVRAILWHQLCDIEADARSEVPTFAQVHGVAAAQKLVRYLILPVELVALGSMLVQLESWFPVVALAVYAITLVLRRLFWRQVTIAITPIPRHVLIFQDYYTSYLGPAVLLALSWTTPGDWLPFAGFAILFWRPLWLNAWRVIKLGHHIVVWLRAVTRGTPARPS